MIRKQSLPHASYLHIQHSTVVFRIRAKITLQLTTSVKIIEVFNSLQQVNLTEIFPPQYFGLYVHN
jgi:hypothetical protein